MFPPREKSLSTRQWWVNVAGKFLRAQWHRVGLGCIVGALVAIAVHLLSRDSAFATSLRQNRVDLSDGQRFDVLSTYKSELVALCIGIAIVAVIPVFLWSWRYVRAWWAGIISFTTLLTASATFAALQYGPTYPKTMTALGLSSLAILFRIEYWRQQSKPSPLSIRQLKLNIPVTKTDGSAEQRWEASTWDDPISDWQEDIIGRVAVVECLAEHALVLRTPIVAVHGSFGDGKTSVLNLFRKAVEGQAIVVSFSSWLPGSEATLASDLFRDIATECKKYVHVPQLRKKVLAYARTVSGSLPYLAGVKALLPTHSQQEEVQELRDALSRVPLPIVILLDDIDRMQKEELLVLLKILRGASSIPNVTFICAFSKEAIEKELQKDGGLSHDYMEKFFPVSVNLSAPDPDILGRLFQARLIKGYSEQKWFRMGEDARKFTELLEQTQI